MSRNTNPPPDPIVQELLDDDQPPETVSDAEDVISLVGFVGNGRPAGGDGPRALRVHPDKTLQRWLEIPREAVVHSEQIDPGDPFTRSVVWVDRCTMMEPILSEQGFDAVEAALATAPLSTWNLIPNSRLVAAGLLGLIGHEEDEDGGS